MRNEAPSCRLGNVSCGAVATGSVSFRNVLTLALRAFTNVARGAAVHVRGRCCTGWWRPAAASRADGALDRAGRRIGRPFAGIARDNRLAEPPVSSRSDQRPSRSGAGAKLA